MLDHLVEVLHGTAGRSGEDLTCFPPSHYTNTTSESTFSQESSLSWASGWWLWAYCNAPWLMGPLGTILVHEIFYFGAWLPFLIADFIPQAQKYKLQPKAERDWGQVWRCFKLLMYLHFVIEGPLVILSHPLFLWLGLKTSLPLPDWTTVGIQIVSFFIIEDFWFYWIHRFLHWDAIYKYVHKIHHTHAAPFGIAAEYAHPAETILLGIGTALGPFLALLATGNMHQFTLLFWLSIRLLQTVEVHSGYDFPFSMNRWMPLWGGAEFHDFHHMMFTNNYSSTFTVWDSVFKTNLKYLSTKHPSPNQQVPIKSNTPKKDQ